LGRIITPSNNFDKHVAHKKIHTRFAFSRESMDRRNKSNHFSLLLSFSFPFRAIRDFLTVPVFLRLSESVDSSLPLLFSLLFFAFV